MTTHTPVQSVLDNPRWASRSVTNSQSNVSVQLLTFPGVVGGEFKARIVGLLPEHKGRAEVTISCSGGSQNSASTTHGNHVIPFLEVESFDVQDQPLTVHFLVPFESKGTDEGYVWHLQIQFANGTTEVFEVPICRTFESNPEVSELEIVSAGLSKKDQWYADRSEARFGRSRRKPFELSKENDDLLVSMPSFISGRPSLGRGQEIFWIIVAAVAFVALLVMDGDIAPKLSLAIPLIPIMVVLVFLRFGVSKLTFSNDQMKLRHSLFGISYPTRVKRSNITGFLPKCMGSLGDEGGSYLVVAECKDSKSVFLSAAMLNKNDAYTLVKRLNSFWDLRRNYQAFNGD